MITLDQVLLLQEKVESAVVKIEQLKAENDALRSKCAELTNALSAKTEQFSTFEADQSKIERGIIQALERLNAVENAVLGNAVLGGSSLGNTAPTNVTEQAPAPAEATPTAVEQTVVEPQPEVPPQISIPVPPVYEEPAPAEDSQQGQFDIF